MLYRTILCATDGLEHSDRALARAGTMAGELDSELHVMYIAERIADIAPRAGEFVPELRALEQERARRIRGQLAELVAGDPELTVIPHFVTSTKGSTAAQIAAFADRIDADLIVVGSRGRGPVGAAIVGSTAQRLPHETRRPVLVLAGAPTRPESTRHESLRHALQV